MCRDNGNSHLKQANVKQVVNAAKIIMNSALAIIPNATHAAFAGNFLAVRVCIVPLLKLR